MGVITVEEVSKHNTKNDCWLILHNKVYDVSHFLEQHPGRNATQDFEDVGHSEEAKTMMKEYYKGDLEKSGSESKKTGNNTSSVSTSTSTKKAPPSGDSSATLFTVIAIILLAIAAYFVLLR